MTIPTPAFAMIDECPGWCTIDHASIYAEPGDHEARIVPFTDGSVNLVSGAVEGVEVSISLPSEDTRFPAAEAAERLTEMARALLTAVYRLGVIEDLEQTATMSERVSYSVTLGHELLSLGQAAQLLEES